MADFSIPQVQVPNIAALYHEGQQVGQQNALRAAMQQYGGAAVMGDQNALAALAQHDPQAALSLMSGRQQMDLRERADGRDATSHGWEGERHEQSIAQGSQAMEIARQRAREAAETHAVNLTAAKREQAIQEAGILRTFERVQTPEEWDAQADMMEMPELKGQFAQKDGLVGMAMGITDALAGPVDPDKRYQEVGGRLVDLYAEGGPATVIDEQQDPMSGIGKLAADLQAGRITQEQFDLAVQGMAPRNTTVQSDGQGGFIYSEGTNPVGRPLTEAQSKDNLYLTMAEGAMPGLEAFEAALVGLGGAGNAVAGAVPGGRALQSPEYQQGQVAAREFGAAILRKESGAALTTSDMEWLESRFIPTPTDKPETVVRKREARQRAIAGLKAGMSIEQIEAVTGAIAGSPDSAAGGARQIQSVDEYNDLPSGTVYIDPNGNQRTKR